ncbi:MAG: hypothetical protein ACOCSK_02485, partial [Rhodothermales bacterium]
LGGYLLGSVAWFLASYLSTTVMVCECGIVADVHRRDRAVSWGQISDYFEFSRGLSRGFVILYRDGQNGQKRMELEVPLRQHAEFRRLIDLQLHRRSEPVDQHARGKTALEG